MLNVFLWNQLTSVNGEYKIGKVWPSFCFFDFFCQRHKRMSIDSLTRLFQQDTKKNEGKKANKCNVSFLTYISNTMQKGEEEKNNQIKCTKNRH